MSRTTGPIRLILAALLAASVFAACADDTPDAGSSPSASPTATTIEEADWVITVPAGWTSEDVSANSDARKAIRYGSAEGDFVIVAIDPQGSDFAVDAVWRYEVKDDRFEIVEKTPCTGTGPESQCRTDDTRYEAYVLAKADTPPSVVGHVWYFIIGNTMKASIDEGRFEQIIEGLQVKRA